MNLASEMRSISESVMESDIELNELYDKVISLIKNAANSGKRKIVFPYIDGSTISDSRDKKDKLVRKLNNDGFRVCYGSEISQGIGNWNTEYITW